MTKKTLLTLAIILMVGVYSILILGIKDISNQIKALEMSNKVFYKYNVIHHLNSDYCTMHTDTIPIDTVYYPHIKYIK